MAKYNVHGGHNRKVPGASGILDEVTEDRKVKDAVIKYLRAAGHTAYDCTDDAGTTQSKNLANIVAKCNAHSGITLDISIHLNAGGGNGDEVLYTSSKAKVFAEKVSAAVANALKIKNRGAKERDNLYVLNHTTAPAILVECCFVDSKTDKSKWNVDKCAKAIVEAVTGKAVSGGSSTPGSASSGSGNKTTSSTPSYKVGNTYTLQSNMVVRTGAGTNYRAKKHSELTADGRKHDKDRNGCLDKGTRITCQQVKKSGSNIWVKCPSGWIAAYYNKKTYVK